MKKFKIVSILIILALIAVTIYQNQTYFMAKEGLNFNIYFDKYHTPETANGIYWLSCFAIGFLISYFSSLMFRFKAQKKIKLQNQTIENYRETVQELKKEIDKIKEKGLLNSQNSIKDDIEDDSQEQSQENTASQQA